VSRSDGSDDLTDLTRQVSLGNCSSPVTWWLGKQVTHANSPGSKRSSAEAFTGVNLTLSLVKQGVSRKGNIMVV